MIGFITCLNDILVPHMKSLFDLNYLQAALIQFSFFTAYFVIAFPSSWLISRLGYQRSIVVGLLVSALGAALFYPASIAQSYPLFLVGLFTLAAGFALLQTAMNPYVAVLGPPESSSARLVLSQAFNSVGTTIAPLMGGLFILGTILSADDMALLSPSEVTDYKATQSAAVQVPYLVLMGLLILLAVIMWRLHLPTIADVEGEDERSVSFWAPLKVPHTLKGVFGIFAYVGAEVAIGSFMVNYFQEQVGIGEQDASQYVAYYWGGAMVGRFIGSWLLTHLRPGMLLGVMSVANVLLVSGAMMTDGFVSASMLVLCGLFNSIMFATIFTLAIKDVGVMTNKASSWLIAAILGGAIIPAVQGAIADSTGTLVPSYVVPAICYIYIAYYGFLGSRHTTQGRAV